jgi:hypothetical protein
MITELTTEQSMAEAMKIVQVEIMLDELDIPYLQASLSKMKDRFSIREAATILCPRIHTELNEQSVLKLQIKRLELLIKLAENKREIAEAKKELAVVETNMNAIAHIFA